MPDLTTSINRPVSYRGESCDDAYFGEHFRIVALDGKFALLDDGRRGLLRVSARLLEPVTHRCLCDACYGQ